MASTISAGTTTTTSLVYTADTSGVLQLQTNGTTTAVTIDTAQNVGIGVTPSASWATNWKGVQFSGAGSLFGNTAGNQISLYFNTINGTSNNLYQNNGYATYYSQGAGTGQHAWYVAPSGTAGGTISFTQAMTLDNSGNLIVNSASTIGTGGKVQLISSTDALYSQTSSNAAYAALVLNVQYTAARLAAFQYGNTTTVGTITTNGTGVSYNTSSDRRLKSNIADLTNSGTVIDSLKPRTFTWVSDNSPDVGFIADELQTVLPKAVNGQPNAVDAEGKPVYQQIDASQPELIAYLVAEVQSLRARLKAANIA